MSMKWRKIIFKWNIYIYIYIYEVRTISFRIFYEPLNLSYILENSVCYCYKSFEMTGQYLWFHVSGTATETIVIHPTKAWLSQLVNFKNAIWHFRRTICNQIVFQTWKKNATKTYRILQTAFGASCMNRASVFEWHKRFNEDRESVWNDERCGRSKEDNTPELICQRFRVRVKVTMLRF